MGKKLGLTVFWTGLLRTRALKSRRQPRARWEFGDGGRRFFFKGPFSQEPTWKTVKDCGVASDRNARFRRTMEDAHAAMDELCGPGTAYFAVYDGHGGRGAVNFVQEHLHGNFREQLELGLEVAEAWKAAFAK